MSEIDIAVQDLIPHRPPMILIDRLTACGEDRAEAVKTFCSGDYGVVDGAVPESLLIECLAQTTAAMQGYLARQRRLPPARGMLVGLDNFSFVAAAVVDQPLTLCVQVLNRVGPFCIIAGRVQAGSQLLAEGQFKVFIQSGEDNDQAVSPTARTRP